MRCEERTRTNPERRCVVTFEEWWELLSDDGRRTKPKFWLSSDAWDAATAQSAAEIAGLRAEVERLRAENEGLRSDLSEAKDSIQEYRWGDDL